MTMFTKGQRVQMTAYAIKQGLQGPMNRRIGTVHSIKKLDQNLIHVKRDGDMTQQARTYHVSFWEPLGEGQR